MPELGHAHYGELPINRFMAARHGCMGLEPRLIQSANRRPHVVFLVCQLLAVNEHVRQACYAPSGSSIAGTVRGYTAPRHVRLTHPKSYWFSSRIVIKVSSLACRLCSSGGSAWVGTAYLLKQQLPPQCCISVRTNARWHAPARTPTRSSFCH